MCSSDLPLAGREVQIGADGEILVRGDSIASQVWQHGGLQARDPGWLTTGDLATRNADGELIFAGRKKDVIVTAAGLNIHPQDLEAVLRRQAGLRDGLVVGYESATGSVPAAVLIADGGDDALQSTVDSANRELAPFQQIRYWLRWPQPEFPRTTTGKVLRRQVQSWAQASLAGGGVADPSDRLLEVLRRLGAAKQEITAQDRLVEDLHLDSLAMVQLQSTLETEFGLELDDMVWGEVRTVGDLRALLAQPAIAAGGVSAGAREGSTPVTAAATDGAPAKLPVIPRQKADAVFPRWPWWPAIY